MASTDLPVGTFPDGSTNFGQGTIYIVVASIVTPLMLMFVVLRLYVRFGLQRLPGWDDAACVIATLCQLSYTGILYYVSTVGLGKNVWEVQPRYVLWIVHLVTVNAILVEPSLLFTKLSLFLLYWRLFSRKKFIRWGIYAGATFCTLFYTIAMFIFIGMGSNEKLGLGVNHAVGIVGPITDFYTLGLACAAILDLHMPPRRKFGVLLIFLCGLFACVMSLLSAVYRFKYNDAALTNPTRKLLPVFIVNTIEVGVGIMCGCMPLMPALFTQTAAGSWFSMFRSRQSAGLREDASGELKNSTDKTNKISLSEHSDSDSHVAGGTRPAEHV